MAGSVTDPIFYEVRCPSCNVSFPPETRRCIHCGERTVLPSQAPAPTLRQHGYGDAKGFPVEYDGQADDMAEEVEYTTRSPFRLGFNGLMILIAVIASAWRVCTGG